jgi:hypothetical protein
MSIRLLNQDAAHSFSGSSEEVPPMTEVTRILSAIEEGDTHAAEELLPLVYDELRKLAAQFTSSASTATPRS